MLIVRSLFISSESVLKISRDSLIKSGCVLAGAAGNVFNVADNYIGIATRPITKSIRSSIFSRFRTHFIKMVHLTRIRSSTNARRVSTLATHEPDFRYSTRNVADCVPLIHSLTTTRQWKEISSVALIFRDSLKPSQAGISNIYIYIYKT